VHPLDKWDFPCNKFVISTGAKRGGEICGFQEGMATDTAAFAGEVRGQNPLSCNRCRSTIERILALTSHKRDKPAPNGAGLLFGNLLIEVTLVEPGHA
jgi:hypothetical protein